MSLKENHAFFKKMDALCGAAPQVTVAVSGGADSLYLALQTKMWADKRNVSVMTLTVDHGLRPESSKEAAWVKKVLESNNIPNEVLAWRGKKPATRVEERAREERYRLLLKACKEKGCFILLLGHHMDDQAETVLMRLTHGSGVDGLAAMQNVSYRDGVYLVRPLLSVAHEEIKKALREAGQKWVEDPSNGQDQYARVRLRKASKTFLELGLEPKALALTATRMARARNALEQMTEAFIENEAIVSDGGYAVMDRQAFLDAPEEIQLRVIMRMLKTVGGASKPVRMEQVEKWLADYPRAATLGGCTLLFYQKKFYVAQELARMEKPKDFAAGEEGIWGNFIVKAGKNVTVGPLRDHQKVEGLPAAVRRSLPAFFEKGKLLWVPALDSCAQKADILDIKLKESS